MSETSNVSQGREQALDVARGLAVLAMVWVHFVPEPLAGDTGWWVQLQWASVTWLDGLPAVMFLILVGLAWGVGGGRSTSYVIRRALGLLVLGWVFWRLVWPNDILMPIAMMMLLLGVIAPARRTMRIAVLVAMLLLVPLATRLWGDYAWTDVRADGTHEANHGFGWVTLRYFVLDGAYPLLPWMAFPLFGTLFADMRHDARALRRCMVAGAVLVLAALVVARAWGDAESGGFGAHAAITWQPTSLPFVALWGGSAVLLLAGVLLWTRVRALPVGVSVGAAIGQASLTHYLLHTVVLYQVLKLEWPDEDWSASVGVAAALGYVAFACIVTPPYLRRFGRGPIEALLAWCAGPSGRRSKVHT